MLITTFFTYMQDLFSSFDGACSGVIFLLGTHHIYHYVASDVASYVHLKVLIANLWVKFLSSSQAVSPEGNTSLWQQGSHSMPTLGYTENKHAEVSPIGSLA